MFKKVQEFLKKKEESLKQKQELQKAQQFYKIVKAGSMFVQFVQEDLKKAENTMNRHDRRRMEHDLNKDGRLTPEIVNYYQQKIDMVLMEIHRRLNPPKMVKNPNVQMATEKPKDAK